MLYQLSLLFDEIKQYMSLNDIKKDFDSFHLELLNKAFNQEKYGDLIKEQTPIEVEKIVYVDKLIEVEKIVYVDKIIESKDESVLNELISNNEKQNLLIKELTDELNKIKLKQFNENNLNIHDKDEYEDDLYDEKTQIKKIKNVK